MAPVAVLSAVVPLAVHPVERQVGARRVAAVRLVAQLVLPVVVPLVAGLRVAQRAVVLQLQVAPPAGRAAV